MRCCWEKWWKQTYGHHGDRKELNRILNNSAFGGMQSHYMPLKALRSGACSGVSHVLSMQNLCCSQSSTISCDVA